MNIYSRKQTWKFVLLAVALVIGLLSLWYTNNLVKQLNAEERKKVELWAEGMKQMARTDLPDQDISFVFQVVKNNETVPVIVTDDKDNIIFVRNLDSLRQNEEAYLKSELADMKKHNEPIEISIGPNIKQYIYYKDSILLVKLFYYPLIQLAVIFLFILVAYMAFSSSRKAEQNQVWVGMSKETAHQLGTPISSLMAWLELLKLQNSSTEIIDEIQKDVTRLETITERFSKIGSAPVLSSTNIYDVIQNTINYIKLRTSSKVSFINSFPQEELNIPLNVSLFEWVLENLFKNAIDAIDGIGTISIHIYDHTQVIFIDISDTGKGMPKSRYKTIFRPGFTTKQRGWGLGLSLSKRIIEEYHNGKIFVKSSEVNIGTTFRIVLKKA